MAPTTKRFGLPYVWATWITGLLSGEDSCEYAAWFKAHYKFDKVERGFDFAAWKASHADMVQARGAELRAEGYAVRYEDQNEVKWKGQTAILSGKADIVAFKPGEVLIVDCKGGKPHDKDFWQVLVYLLAGPKVWSFATPMIGARWRGEVCYADHRVTIEPEQLNDEARTRIFIRLRACGAADPPAKVPSRRECGFCDLPKTECPERVEEAEPEMAAAADF